MIKHIYIAGPLTTGSVTVNVNLAVQCADRLRRNGFYPYVPHLSLYWDAICPGASYEEWMDLDFHWLLRCDALLRLPGHSAGADREVAYANAAQIPVFTSELDLYAMRMLMPKEPTG